MIENVGLPAVSLTFFVLHNAAYKTCFAYSHVTLKSIYFFIRGSFPREYSGCFVNFETG